jgi:MFS family permease
MSWKQFDNTFECGRKGRSLPEQLVSHINSSVDTLKTTGVMEMRTLERNVANETAGSIDLKPAARVAVLFSGILAPFALGGLTPVLPAIAAHFAQNPQAGFLTRLLVSIIGAMIVVGSPFVGALADRFGRRRILLIAMLVYALAGCAGYFVDNLYALVATRLLVGLAVAAVGAVMLAMVATHSEGVARNRWLGYINTVGLLVSVVLIPFSGFVGKYGWQWPFLIHIVALPLFLLALVGLEPDQRKVELVRTTSERPSGRVPWGLLATAAAGGVLLLAPSLYVPFHLRDVGISDPRLISVATLLPNLAAAVSAYSFGAVRARLSLTATFILGFGIAAAALLLNAYSQSYAPIVLATTIMGCSCGLIGTNIYAFAAVTGSDSNRARTMGLAKCGMYTGPLLGQLALEPVVKLADAGIALLLLGLFAILLTLIYAWRAMFRQSAAA